MGASPHAGCHCPGTRADAFRVVFARNPVAHTPRKHVEGALKHAKITAKTLRQVMRRKLRSTGRKSATNYLSGTTLILTINKRLLPIRSIDFYYSEFQAAHGLIFPR